jgi:HPr kinase/phosphorylase
LAQRFAERPFRDALLGRAGFSGCGYAFPGLSTAVRHISLAQLYEDNREKLLLSWVTGHSADSLIELKISNNYGADVVGHINIIHPERLQVMGQAEYDWAVRIGERRFGQQCADLLIAHPPAVIIADSIVPASVAA